MERKQNKTQGAPVEPNGNAKINKAWLIAVVIMSGIFAAVYGDQISAFEDALLAKLFGR